MTADQKPDQKPGRKESQLRLLVGIALPIMLSSLLSFLMNIVDLLFVGHLGTDKLASAALGNTVWATVALPMQGCVSALDTFLSQAYGAKHYVAYARWTQARAMLVKVLQLVALPEPNLFYSTGGHDLHDGVVSSFYGYSCSDRAGINWDRARSVSCGERCPILSLLDTWSPAVRRLPLPYKVSPSSKYIGAGGVYLRSR